MTSLPDLSAGRTTAPTTPSVLRNGVLASLGLTRSDTFTWGDVERAGDTVRLHYELDGVGPLVEELVFHGVTLDDLDGPATRALDRALRVAHLLAGVSYLKATLPPVLHTGPTSPAMRALLHAVVTDGLAELAWDHDVDLTDHFSWPDPVEEPAPAAPVGATAGPLVPIGGGKDSIVTLDAIVDHQPTLFAVNPRGPILRTFDQAARPTITVTRRLDPRLFELNDRGAVNGHVPITAIVSAIAVVAAVAGGHGAVLLSNERSADQPTLVLDDGRAVNHQWSKSSAFERSFAAIVADEVAPDVAYLSLLRGASELWIARRFSDLGTWDATFNSCNRAFHLRGERRDWCGQCPKCRFVFLALAPFMGRERVTGILGRNLLDDPGQVADYAALVGLADHKPFECVGEEEESAAALATLAADPAWADDVVVASLGPQLPVGPDAIADHLGAPDPALLPPAWRDVLA